MKPWEREWRANDGDVQVWSEKNERYLDVLGACGDGTVDDAHLAAAAPDMYRVLDSLQYAARDARGDGMCPSCFAYQHSDDCELDAALKKARGEVE